MVLRACLQQGLQDTPGHGSCVHGVLTFLEGDAKVLPAITEKGTYFKQHFVLAGFDLRCTALQSSRGWWLLLCSVQL
jgi:hypothetical protein